MKRMLGVAAVAAAAVLAGFSALSGGAVSLAQQPEQRPSASEFADLSGPPPPTCDATILANVTDFEPWLRRDADTLVERMISAVRSAPSDPATLALLWLYSDSTEEAADPDALAKAAADVSNTGANLAVFGPNARFMQRLMLESAMRRGDFSQARVLERAVAGLQDWLIAGPFAPTNGGDFHYDALQPEALVATGRPMRGAWGAVNWTPWKPEVPSDCTWRPSDVSVLQGAGWFGLVWVVNDGPEREVTLDIEAADGGVKAWLGGKQVFARRPERDRSRDDSVRVTLPAGKSSLLVKTGLSTSICARVVDPETRLSVPGVHSARYDGPAFIPHGGVHPADDPVDPAWERMERIAAWRGKGESQAGPASALMALLYATNDHPEIAEDYCHQSEAWRLAAPDRAACFDVLYYRRRVIATEAEKQRIMKDRLAQLIAGDPDQSKHRVMPRVELARILGTEQQEKQATQLFEEALKARECWPARIEYSRYYSSLGWSAEARNQIELALSRNKAQTPALMLERAALATTDMNDADAVTALDKVLAAWPGHTGAAARRLEIARLRGENPVARGLIAREIERAGGTSQALAVDLAEQDIAEGNWTAGYDRLMGLASEWPAAAVSYWRRAAALAAGKNDVARARAAYTKVLEKQPGDDFSANALAVLAGSPERSLSEFSTPVTHEMLDWLKAEDYPKASGGHLLDEEVWLVERDGSFTAYGQQVMKVLRQEGVDLYGRESVPGEVVRVRTMLADGGEAEPASVNGRSFEFPQVAPGNATDYAYRQHHRGTERKTIEGVTYTFADHDLRVPTAIARLVVVTPPGMELSFRELNAGVLTRTRETLPDGRVKQVWECRKPRSIEEEDAMPSVDELLPAVEFVMSESRWEDVARRVRGSLEASQVTWLVRETGEKILKEAAAAAKAAEQAEPQEGGDMKPAGEKPAPAKPVPANPDPKAEEPPLPSDPIDRARAFYDWVNKTVTSERGGQHPHLTILQHEGDRLALFLALLDADGIGWHVVSAELDPDRTTAPRYLDADSGGARTLYLIDPYSDHPVLVDMSQRFAPFGWTGAESHEGAGFVVDPETGEWRLVRLDGNDGFARGSSLEATVVLAAGANAKVFGAQADNDDAGYAAAEAAPRESETKRKQTLESDLSGGFEGITLDTAALIGTGEPGQPLRRGFNGTAPVLKADGAGWTFVPGITRLARTLDRYVSLPDRKFDLVVRATVDTEETITYVLPQGYALAEVPTDFVLAATPFTYSLTFELGRSEAGLNLLTIRRNARVLARRIPAAQYDSFRTQVKAINKAETTALKLVKIG
jgi:hypothetical protein